VTAEPELALRTLITDLCASEDAPTFAARWGRPVPSERRPGGIRVECDPTGPFAVLEVRPWTDDITGVVDVELSDRSRLSWAALRDQFGPFERMTPLDAASDRYSAGWTPTAGSPSAFLMVGVTGDRVSALTIRRDPP
jgi:hypothetical protein